MTAGPPRRRRRRRSPPAGSALSVALLLGGGAALAVGAPAGARPAPTPRAGPTLGGFTITALAEAVTAQYEQPNFPLPATPSLEFDEGYAATTENFGPDRQRHRLQPLPGPGRGQRRARARPAGARRAVAPGTGLARRGRQRVPADAQYASTRISPASTWTPELRPTATRRAPASATTPPHGGRPSGPAPTPTAPGGLGQPARPSTSSLVGIGSMSATSSSSGTGTTANASHGHRRGRLLPGRLDHHRRGDLDGDGHLGRHHGHADRLDLVADMTIAGEAVTINANGIHGCGHGHTAPLPISSINTLLNQLGISLAVTNATDTMNGPSASRTLDGLKITIDLTTLDNAANQFASLLPSSLTSQLPVAVPDDQQLTLDLGTVQVSSTASPAFTAGTRQYRRGLVAARRRRASSAGGSAGAHRQQRHRRHRRDLTGDSGSGSPSTGGTGRPAPAAIGLDGTGRVGGSQPAGLGHHARLQGHRRRAGAARAPGRRRRWPTPTSGSTTPAELVGPACADGDPLIERFAPIPTTSPIRRARLMKHFGSAMTPARQVRFAGSPATPGATAGSTGQRGRRRRRHPGRHAACSGWPRSSTGSAARARSRNMRRWLELIGMR